MPAYDRRFPRGPMIIRNAQAGDAADIVELLAQLGYPGTEGFVPDKIERLLGHRDAELLVAEDGDRLLGFIGLHFMVQLALPGDFCRITYFCVSDAARGSGWAALEEAAAALALARGCDRIEVHCHERRVDAPLLLPPGLRRVAQVPDEVLPALSVGGRPWRRRAAVV
ncbi:GNAT family N-acetyltransferase [Achromobacter insuavis]